jgi:hypothetical protein
MNRRDYMTNWTTKAIIWVAVGLFIVMFLGTVV